MFALFTPLLHSNNMVTLPGQQRFLFGVVLSIYEVFFIANIRLNVIGFFTSFMLKTMPEQRNLCKQGR